MVLDLSMPFGPDEPFHIRHVLSAKRFDINHDRNQKFLMEFNVVVPTIPFANRFSLDLCRLIFLLFFHFHDEKATATRRKPNVDHMF